MNRRIFNVNELLNTAIEILGSMSSGLNSITTPNLEKGLGLKINARQNVGKDNFDIESNIINADDGYSLTLLQSIDVLTDSLPSFSQWQEWWDKTTKDACSLCGIESIKGDAWLESLIRMSAHVYGTRTDALLPEGWKKVPDKQHPDVSFNDNRTGLTSALYYNEQEDKYVYAFAGTKNLKDVKADLSNLLGMSSQYAKALENSQKLLNRIPLERLCFTGHSKGGGEAAYCADVLKGRAYTFNPAGPLLTRSNLIKAGFIEAGRIIGIKSLPLLLVYGVRKCALNMKKNQTTSGIDAYFYTTDLLNAVQRVGQITPLGEIHHIGKLPKKMSFSEWHGIDGFLTYMDVAPCYK